MYEKNFSIVFESVINLHATEVEIPYTKNITANDISPFINLFKNVLLDFIQLLFHISFSLVCVFDSKKFENIK